MKLHLEAHSERGKPVTKSGNDFLYLSIKDDNREVVMSIELRIYEDEVGDGLKAHIRLADHVYARIAGEQIQVITDHGKINCMYDHDHTQGNCESHN